MDGSVAYRGAAEGPTAILSASPPAVIELLRAQAMAASLALLIMILLVVAAAVFARWLRRILHPRPPAAPSRYVPKDDWYQKPLVPPAAPSEGGKPDEDAAP